MVTKLIIRDQEADALRDVSVFVKMF